MYPPVLMLYTHLGRLLLGTRARTMTVAAENAKTTGFRGLRYPWESALTGRMLPDMFVVVISFCYNRSMLISYDYVIFEFLAVVCTV